jgi:hypothetical protein
MKGWGAQIDLHSPRKPKEKKRKKKKKKKKPLDRRVLVEQVEPLVLDTLELQVLTSIVCF